MNLDGWLDLLCAFAVLTAWTGLFGGIAALVAIAVVLLRWIKGGVNP